MFPHSKIFTYANLKSGDIFQCLPFMIWYFYLILIFLFSFLLHLYNFFSLASFLLSLIPKQLLLLLLLSCFSRVQPCVTL